MAFLNYTTKIDAVKTIGEISSLLGKAGARSIISNYDENRLMSSMSFVLHENGTPILFQLPCNWEGVHRIIEKDKSPNKRPWMKTKEHAYNVAWRVVKTWVESQLAMVEANQASLAALFLTWSVTANGETLGQRVLNNDAKELKLLLPGSN